jgi:hypothetical protein
VEFQFFKTPFGATYSNINQRRQNNNNNMNGNNNGGGQQNDGGGFDLQAWASTPIKIFGQEATQGLLAAGIVLCYFVGGPEYCMIYGVAVYAGTTWFKEGFSARNY